MTATVAAETTPAGNAPESFNRQLDDVVSQYIGELVDRRAVDEANGDVLDTLIDHAVAQDQDRIAHDSVSRREHLNAFAAHLERERALAEDVAETARARAETSASRVRSLLRSICGAPAAGEKAGDPVDIEWVRAFIMERRSHWAAIRDASIRSAGLADVSELASATDSARQRLESAERDLAAARADHAAAVGEKEAALQHLRGDATRSGPGTDAALAKGDQES